MGDTNKNTSINKSLTVKHNQSVHEYSITHVYAQSINIVNVRSTIKIN